MTDSIIAHDPEPNRGRLDRFWPLLWLVWLPFLDAPLMALFGSHPATLRLVVILSALAVFVAVYVWTAWSRAPGYGLSSRPARGLPGPSWLPLVVLTSLSLALIMGDGSRWLALFIFTSAAAGLCVPQAAALRAVAALTLLALLLDWWQRDPLADLVQGVILIGGIGGGVVVTIIWAISTARALRAAQEDNARLAVTTERLRIARDLHDLLGHDLAHIALKTEMAEHLVPSAPDQAVKAMREVAEAARTSLRQVREAVAGYRQPTLPGELRGAREMLAAAGIDFLRQGEPIALPPAAEAMLAWTVREGVTNVIRHSRASHCTIRLTQDADRVGVEVIDDGQKGCKETASSPAASVGGGHGLAGLSERVATLSGRFDAGPDPTGGFRLAVTVPVKRLGVKDDLSKTDTLADGEVARRPG